MKLVVETIASVRITNNVLAETTHSAVLTSDKLILSVEVALPDQFFVALTR